MLRHLLYIIWIFLFLVITIKTKSQFIYDTLQLNELEIISSIDDINSTIKKTTIDSIARKELKLSNIGELLASYTPVFVKSYGKGSLATVSFRGTGASHTKVLWEGFDINSPMLGQTDFSLLPGIFFDEVELYYGGSSLSKSSGALGGSVVLKSNGIHQIKNPVIIEQTIGSFSTYQSSIGINLKKSKLYSGTRIFRQSSKNNFKYYNNAILPTGQEMTQKNADFVNIGFTQQFSYQLNSKQNLTFITWNQWNNRNIPTIMANIEKGGNQEEWQDDFFSKNILKWELNSTGINWKVVGAYFYDNMSYYLKTSNSLNTEISIIDSQNKIESYSLKANMSSEISNGLIIKTGIKLVHEKVNSNNYIDIKKRSLVDAFVSAKKKLSHKFTAQALIRSEVSDIEFTPIMPMIGINYKPINSTDLHLRLVLSRNQNNPSLNDLYWYPGGNEELLPEISLDSELGIDYLFHINTNNIAVSSSIYASSVKNWIMWRRGDYTYLSPENIANVFARGIDLSVKTNGNIKFFTYSLFCEYAYTRSTNNSQEAKRNGTLNTQLLYVPIHSLVGYLNLGYRRFSATWNISYTGERNTSLNTDDYFKVPSYLLNNVSIGKSLNIKNSDIYIRFKVINLFDIDYQEVLWRAMPGRNYEFSLSVKL